EREIRQPQRLLVDARGRTGDCRIPADHAPHEGDGRRRRAQHRRLRQLRQPVTGTERRAERRRVRPRPRGAAPPGLRGGPEEIEEAGAGKLAVAPAAGARPGMGVELLRRSVLKRLRESAEPGQRRWTMWKNTIEAHTRMPTETKNGISAHPSSCGIHPTTGAPTSSLVSSLCLIAKRSEERRVGKECRSR